MSDGMDSAFEKKVTIRTPIGEIVEEGDAALLSDHATEFMIRHLDIASASTVAEAGCGSGVLCIFASRAGAAKVYGTDIDEKALDTARRNAENNGARNIVFLHGSLLEPIAEKLDAVIALLPHKPAPRPFNHRYYGGVDGTDLLMAVIAQSAEKLRKGGRLYLYLNSIANPKKVLSVFREKFEVSMLAEKKRRFTQAEFDGLTKGMFQHMLALRQEGKCDFEEDAEGLFFIARIYAGRLR